MFYSWNLIGHQKQLLSLENDLKQGKLSHAYLLHGPAQVGKFTAAFLMAKILLCPHHLCHQCQTCKWMEAGVHPDFVVMRDDGETIKIDQVRDLIATINLTPQGKKRVVLIQNIDRMPTEAQNAFLKTLEEPPEDTMFLLTSSEPKKVLPTILSRVRPLEFSLLPEDELKGGLQSRFSQIGNMEEAIQIAQGRPGLAIMLLEHPLKMSEYREFYYRLEGFFKNNDLISKFAFVEEVEKDPEKLELFFEVMSALLRKMAENRLNGRGPTLVEAYDLTKIHELFEKLMETRYLISRNVNKRLALENFFLATER